jgi:hypothetical protein
MAGTGRPGAGRAPGRGEHDGGQGGGEEVQPQSALAVVAIGLGAGASNEPITALSLAGIALVLLGAYLTGRRAAPAMRSRRNQPDPGPARPGTHSGSPAATTSQRLHLAIIGRLILVPGGIRPGFWHRWPAWLRIPRHHHGEITSSAPVLGFIAENEPGTGWTDSSGRSRAEALEGIMT